MGHYGSGAFHPAAGNPTYFRQGNTFLGYMQAYLTRAMQPSQAPMALQARQTSRAMQLHPIST